MIFVAFSGIVTFVSSLACSIFVLLSLHRNIIKITWSIFSFAVGLWGLGLFKAFTAQDYQSSLLWFRILNLSAIIIPISFFHFSLLFTNRLKNKKIELLFYYSVVMFYLVTVLFYPNLFLSSVSPKLDFKFYPDPGSLYYLFPFLFAYLSIYGVIVLIQDYKNVTQIRRNQFKYILIGVMVGFSGGASTFFLVFDLRIYPFGVILVPFYVLMVTFSIIKYMDLKLAVTRLGILIVVYTLVLGIPVWIGFKLFGFGLWLIPVALMGFFATAGPFIYLYVQKRTEDMILQEQRSYQTTLRQASAGMSRIKDLKKLLNLIVYIVSRAVRLEHALVYMHDRPKNQFILGAHKRRSGNVTFIKTIADDSPLITYLIETGAPIVYEELKQKIQDYADQDLVAVEKMVAALEGDLVLPILIEKRLLAIIILGKKESGKLYSEDDLSVFSILANQTALAIENAQFYEDMKITQEQLFQAEKMATIGTMADGLSHQINNRFHALGFIAGDALYSLKLSKNMEGSDKVKELLADLERAFNRVQENVVQGGEGVQGLLKYTRKGDAGFTAIDFNQAFKSAFEMAQFKIKVQELQVVHAYDPQNIPKIKGNFTQLQEVFFNLIDNAYDAMMQRKTEKQEP